MSKKNKHGLSKDIPEKIKREIRRTDGFSCIFCGCPMIEYEHIEPPFCDAKSHDPKCMTLLCPQHHAKVTKNIISKEQVWTKKELRSKSLASVVYNDEERNSIHKLLIGSNLITLDRKTIVLSIDGNPFLWLEPDQDDEENTIKLSGSFFDSNGKKIVDIIKNEYKITDQRLCSDVTYKASIFTIKDKNQNIVFKMDFSNPLKLLEMKFTVGNSKIEILKSGILNIINTLNNATTTISGCRLNGGSIFTILTKENLQALPYGQRSLSNPL